MQRWEELNPEKRRAQFVIGNAIRDGKIKRPTTCEVCGSQGRVEAHHPDYGKPLEVQWLCTKCHGETRLRRSA